MLGSALGFTVMTALIKLLGSNYPAALQTFYRQLAGLIILLPIIVRDWRGALRTHRPWILIYRSGIGVVAMILSFYAYQKLPLADANALSFTRSLWMVPLALFVLKERVGPLQIAAALVGFGGVLIMLQPTGQGGPAVGTPQLAALASAFLFATTITGMKVLTRDHRPVTLLVYSAILGLVFSVPPAIFVWKIPALPDLGLLAAMGVMGTVTQACYIKGMQVGDAGAMAPIDYTRLVFALILGWFMFHSLPSVQVITGAAIVVASTLIITLREQHLSRRARQAAQADSL
jgi:drug/metabolite transporter (DMT)-like permease